MQMQWASVVLISVLALAQFTWTMLLAVVVKVISLTVHVVPMSTALMVTHKMLEWDVKVDFSVNFELQTEECVYLLSIIIATTWL